MQKLVGLLQSIYAMSNEDNSFSASVPVPTLFSTSNRRAHFLGVVPESLLYELARISHQPIFLIKFLKYNKYSPHFNRKNGLKTAFPHYGFYSRTASWWRYYVDEKRLCGNFMCYVSPAAVSLYAARAKYIAPKSCKDHYNKS